MLWYISGTFWVLQSGIEVLVLPFVTCVSSKAASDDENFMKRFEKKCLRPGPPTSSFRRSLFPPHFPPRDALSIQPTSKQWARDDDDVRASFAALLPMTCESN